MNLFVAFKYMITIDGQTVADEGFRSEIFEDMNAPYNEETLRAVEQEIRDFLLFGMEKGHAAVTILDWKEIGLVKEIHFQKYQVAATAFASDHPDDDPLYSPNLFGYVGVRKPVAGDFVLNPNNGTMWEWYIGAPQDEAEIWHLIDEETIEKVLITR